MISHFNNNSTIYVIGTTILLQRKACMNLPHFPQLKKDYKISRAMNVKYASKSLINALT